MSRFEASSNNRAKRDNQNQTFIEKQTSPDDSA